LCVIELDVAFSQRITLCHVESPVVVTIVVTSEGAGSFPYGRNNPAGRCVRKLQSCVYWRNQVGQQHIRRRELKQNLQIRSFDKIASSRRPGGESAVVFRESGPAVDSVGVLEVVAIQHRDDLSEGRVPRNLGIEYCLQS
jgi:hypothetical protein